jgi:hypothetical protein
MMSNNRSLAPEINDHLPIEDACEGYSSDCKKMVAIIQQVIAHLISLSLEQHAY